MTENVRLEYPLRERRLHVQVLDVGPPPRVGLPFRGRRHLVSQREVGLRSRHPDLVRPRRVYLPRPLQGRPEHPPLLPAEETRQYGERGSVAQEVLVVQVER